MTLLGPHLRSTRPWPVLVACMLLSGCGSSAASDPVAPTDDRARARAVAVVNQLRDAGLPVQDIVACTPPAPAPAGHPRPHAAAFDDSRVSSGADLHVVREGGVVEVYDSAAKARARVHELDAQTLTAQAYGFDEGGQALHAERRFQVGPVLLRLSGALPAPAAGAYASVLAQTAATGPLISMLDNSQEAPCST